MDTLSTPLRVFPPFVSLTLLFCLPLSPIIYPCPAVKPRSRPEFCPPGR
jgi:ABC-type polysaccharide/polyol phosphate export permease